jgi:hypothetical protein
MSKQCAAYMDYVNRDANRFLEEANKRSPEDAAKEACWMSVFYAKLSIENFEREKAYLTYLGKDTAETDRKIDLAKETMKAKKLVMERVIEFMATSKKADEDDLLNKQIEREFEKLESSL